MTDFEDKLLQATYASRLVALREFELQNSCVETTRILLLVLDKLGIQGARPQAVNVRVFNQLALAAFSQGLPFDEWPDGAHAMGTDPNPEAEAANPNGWSGHLVVVVRKPEGGRKLIDASADQFDRPGSINVPGPVGMDIKSIWTPMDPQYRILQDEDTVIEYMPVVGTRSTEWREFPAWVRDPEWFDQQAEDIAQQVRDGWEYVIPDQNGKPE